MSPPWSNTLDVERLADARASLEFRVPVGELALREQYAGLAGEVSGHLKMERAAGIPVGELKLSGTVQLTCQRCLTPLTVQVERQARIGLIESEAELDRVPEDLEPVLAPKGRTSMAALVAEELLLSLPLVPQHERLEECAAEAALPSEPAEQAPPTQRPFADLGKLLLKK
jgi:uncharacterized protein